MNYKITTYDINGNEIVSRNFTNFLDGLVSDGESRSIYADQIESILEDSAQYLEEQALDYKEELTREMNEEEKRLRSETLNLR